jgi:hypothetical protein
MSIYFKKKILEILTKLLHAASFLLVWHMQVLVYHLYNQLHQHHQSSCAANTATPLGPNQRFK